MFNITNPYRLFQVFIFAILFSLPFVSLAQEKPATNAEPVETEATVVANINISDATILTQAPDGILRVVSTITNNGTKTQSDIRIGLYIVKVTDGVQTTVDSVVSDQTLSLAPGESLQQELQYENQDSLSGDYEIWVVSRTTGGIMLGLNMAGKMTYADAASAVTIISESCTVQIDSDKNKYNLTQGVNVKSTENLLFNCLIENHTTNNVTVVPSFFTYRHSAYGELLADINENSQEVTLLAKEKKAVSFVIPKASEPQAYDVKIVLTDKSTQTQISNKVTAHYILTGNSATILNAVLDKNSYVKDEALLASIFFTSFAEPSSTITVKISVLDSAGKTCIEPIEKKVAVTEANPVELQTTTIADCVSPQMNVTLLDEAGKTLDDRIFASAIVQASDNEEMPMAINDSFSKNAFKVLIGLLFLAGIIYFIRRQKNDNVASSPTNTIKSIFFLTIISSGVFMGAGEAQALTFTGALPQISSQGFATFIATYGTTQDTFTVNLNKSTYAPGETIILSASITVNPPNDYSFFPIMTMSLNGQSVAMSGFSGGTTFGTKSLIAPSVPGSYSISVTGCNAWGCVSGSIPFVEAVAAVNGACNMSAPNACAVGTLGINTRLNDGSYQWYCNGSNGGVNSSLCYYTPPTSPSPTGTANGSCNMSTPNTCTSGVLGANAIQTNGDYHWYCNGVNGGTGSNLCYYTPSGVPTPPPVTPPPTGTYNGATCDYLTADNLSLAPGESTTLHGSCLDATYGNGISSYSLNYGSLEYFEVSVFDNYNGRGSQPYPGISPHLMKDTVVGPFAASSPRNKRYTLDCRSRTTSGFGVGDGSCTVNVMINVVPPDTPLPAPTVTFTANPSSINNGGSSNLIWTSTGATSCSATGGTFGGSKIVNGSQAVSPVVTTTYTIECKNSDNVSSGVKRATVTVANPSNLPINAPNIQINADPKIIRSGDTANVEVIITSSALVRCNLYGVSNNPIVINHNGLVSPRTYSNTTRPLTSAQEVSVICDYPDFIGTFPPVTKNTRVDVVPTNQEI